MLKRRQQPRNGVISGNSRLVLDELLRIAAAGEHVPRHKDIGERVGIAGSQSEHAFEMLRRYGEIEMPNKTTLLITSTGQVLCRDKTPKNQYSPDDDDVLLWPAVTGRHPPYDYGRHTLHFRPSQVMYAPCAPRGSSGTGNQDTVPLQGRYR